MPLKSTYTPAHSVRPGGDSQIRQLGDGGISNSPDGSWGQFVQSFRDPAKALLPPWDEVFGPLQSGTVDDLVVIGQIGQSLDGRIATESGHSKYINGPGGLTHLHRLRSLVDAVVIGVGTALADDPQLTVRRVAGPQPARVVLDPKGRLPASAKIFTSDGGRSLLVTAEGTRHATGADIEVVTLPAADGRIAPPTLLAALAERGMHRILIEGGANTVSLFLAAGCFDRLHVMVAPIILGSGRESFILPPVERADQALHIPIRTFRLDEDILFDCDMSAQRIPVGRAKKST